MTKRRARRISDSDALKMERLLLQVWKDDFDSTEGEWVCSGKTYVGKPPTPLLDAQAAEEAHTKAMEEVTCKAHELLFSPDRPDRLDKSDDSFLWEVTNAIDVELPPRQARRQVIFDIVRSVERGQTRSTNTMLREMHKTGQFPLDWFDVLNWPLAVEKERVTLRACTPGDLRRFGVSERRDAAAEFTTWNETCVAAEAMAERMEAEGAAKVRELRYDEGNNNPL